MLNTSRIITSASFRLLRMMSHTTSSESAGVPWKEIRIPVPWGHIAGKEWGNSNGERILAVHGWMDNSATWDLLAPLLKLNKLHLICLDLPGHGQSSHLPPGSWYRWIDYVGAITRAADYLKWDRFSLLAHSMGAKAAFIYAGCFPDQIKKLVSCDVHVPFPGGNRILFKPQLGFHNDWNWAEIYRTFFEFLLKIEQSSNSGLKGKTMEQLVDRLMEATSDMNSLTRNSARIILQRGTWQVSDNPDLYVVTRDRRLAIYDFLAADQHFRQICRKMTCDLLIIMPVTGIMSLYPSFGLEMLKFYEENLKVYKFEHVTGTHHEHLNNPQKFAPLINSFLSS